MKRGDLSINIIIVAAIALLILVIIRFMFQLLLFLLVKGEIFWEEGLKMLNFLKGLKMKNFIGLFNHRLVRRGLIVEEVVGVVLVEEVGVEVMLAVSLRRVGVMCL